MAVFHCTQLFIPKMIHFAHFPIRFSQLWKNAVSPANVSVTGSRSVHIVLPSRLAAIPVSPNPPAGALILQCANTNAYKITGVSSWCTGDLTH